MRDRETVNRAGCRRWARVLLLAVWGFTPCAAENLDRVSLPTIDLDREQGIHVVVDREEGQYLGHPTTTLLPDGMTILAVYPKGHGRGAIVYKRSSDGGRTWSDRLPTPENWATSREVPTIHRVSDSSGRQRLILWSGLYPARLAVSEDLGLTWSPLRQVGSWGGIVVMGFVEAVGTDYLAMFHDDGRYFQKENRQKDPVEFTLYRTWSHDGGLNWTYPDAVWRGSDVHLCEPGVVRSPDGKEMAVLLRENARRKNSHIIFSSDNGKSWSSPRELPLALTGDRHTAGYAPDGRLLISFRCRSPRGKEGRRPFEGDWVAWVGTYEDLVKGGEGQYMVRLKRNFKDYDCAYPGVEVLQDGTFVVTTYGHWEPEKEPFILSARFRLDRLDRMAGSGP